MTHAPRWVVLLPSAVLVALVALWPASVRAARPGPVQDAAAASPEQQLAERYAPIAMLKAQDEPCGDGEPFQPAPVEIVLGDPAVVLQDNVAGDAGDDPVLLSGPVATDLPPAPETAYLDFPGNPRDPGCDYERHFKERMSGFAPTTYAHVVVDAAEGRLALQYWFYYTFNDWNNTHETDWEMIQLVFAAASAEEALAEEPVRVGYAQHGGGELADWNDEKLERDGDHPIVYPAAGSHGTYFGSHVYVGWGEGGTGFGCDDTTGPSNRVPLTPVLVPNEPDPTGPFAWALYQGRWGERQPWEFNGPTGPNLGTKWTDPFGAVETWRTSSLKVPDTDAIGPSATDLFCRLSAFGSGITISYGVYPWLSVLTAVAVVAVVVVLFVAARGLVGEALGIYQCRWRTFLGLGLIAIPIGWLFNGLQLLVVENPPLEWVVKWFNDTAGARLTAALIVGGLQQAAMLLFIAPAIIRALADVAAGREPGVVESYRAVLGKLPIMAGALLILVVALGVLGLLIVGIPLAIWLVVRWQFFGQTTVFDGAPSSRAALRVSAKAVEGRWWWALGASLAFQLIGALPGPLIGVVLLIFGKTSVQFANGVSSFLYALTIPVAVIGLTLVYLRLTDRPALLRRATTAPEPAAAPAPPPA